MPAVIFQNEISKVIGHTVRRLIAIFGRIDSLNLVFIQKLTNHQSTYEDVLHFLHTFYTISITCYIKLNVLYKVCLYSFALEQQGKCCNKQQELIASSLALQD